MPSELELADDNGCFVCGKLNPIGLKLEFDREGDEYVTYFTPGKQHQGYVGVTHGGIVSTVLDEVMARYVHVLGYMAVTGEMTIRLRKPARTGVRLKFAGKIESESGRLISTSARATDDEGTLVAEATGKMIRVG
ncbi:MAG: PaaI family thioesterase [Armatimonadetes bacterium]|nr:PaaI family thioesterase [Armatimonadota bacterium]